MIHEVTGLFGSFLSSSLGDQQLQKQLLRNFHECKRESSKMRNDLTFGPQASALSAQPPRKRKGPESLSQGRERLWRWL